MSENASRAIAWLRSAGAVRARAELLLSACEAGELRHFALRPERLDDVVALVAETTRARFPDLRIPPHSRWRHFELGGRDRWRELAAGRAVDARELARIRLDLAVVSVLLDAGTGPGWSFRDPGSGVRYGRSEGLALASLEAFRAGRFSASPDQPLRCDADALARLRAADIAAIFQTSAHNPLVGQDGRLLLLHRLGRVLRERPELFGRDGRIGALADHFARQAAGGGLAAETVLRVLLDAFGPLWPHGLRLLGTDLGDVGRHPAATTDDATSGLVPFHKLSQWLAYSLVEPLEEADIAVSGIDRLTALAEYRNGGLLLDGDLLRPKHQDVLGRRHLPGSEIVVEWRALTVALVDRIAAGVREALGAPDLGLAQVLEGGTWHAGRRLAHARRSDGAPPLDIDSDGTVF